MKYALILSFMLAFSISGCKKKKGDDKASGDIATLIIGKWKFSQFACNSGYTFKSDGTWSHGDFSACGNTCGSLPFGGTYTINGDTITATGGPGQGDAPNGKVVIDNGSLKIYDTGTGQLLLSLSLVNGC